jgi:hypothetical protein
MAEKNRYEIIVTKPARDRFQNEILSYINKSFSNCRGLEVENNLKELLLTLQIDPQRGSVEKLIQIRDHIFRFVLHKETKFFEIKIIYFIEESEHKVLVTDFFSTKMNPLKMRSES